MKIVTTNVDEKILTTNAGMKKIAIVNELFVYVTYKKSTVDLNDSHWTSEIQVAGKMVV